MENPSIQAPPVIPTNPEHPLYQPPVKEAQGSSKTALFTAISLVILAVIIIITLYLYFQNRNLASNNAPKLQNATQNQNQAQAQNVSKEDTQKLQKYGVICKQFKSVEQALKTPEIACGLNLSGQKLTSLPNGVEKLTNLNSINLSNNDFTTFPSELLKLPNLYSIDLSNNNIASLPSQVFQSKTLQSVVLTENPIQNKEQSTSSSSSQLHITY